MSRRAALGAAAGSSGSVGRLRHLTAANLAAVAILATSIAILGYAVNARYGTGRFAAQVREAFSAQRYERAREPLRQWLAAQPDSGEAQYYRAWLALADNQAPQAADAIERANKLRFDPGRLQYLAAIFQSLSGQFNEAEAILRQGFNHGSEPRALVARELARIYLKTYRLAQAAEPIERWKNLSPEDPQPYLWSNEIASRSGTLPPALIHNYRMALERDPSLDKARLGLADQLGKNRRFDEAEREFQIYLGRNPDDAGALVGLGRNAFQAGDFEAANRHFEAALRIDPRQPEALRELALSDLRGGQAKSACKRYELLIQAVPYDFDIRYAYSQALRLSGDEPRARAQGELAARLRKEHEQSLQIQRKLLESPGDMEARFQAARWMFEHGHPQEGLKWTAEILRVQPRHAPTHRLLTDYYQREGNPGLANYHRVMASSGVDTK